MVQVCDFLGMNNRVMYDDENGNKVPGAGLFTDKTGTHHVVAFAITQQELNDIIRLNGKIFALLIQEKDAPPPRFIVGSSETIRQHIADIGDVFPRQPTALGQR